jgi:hypothetical protein
MKKICEGEDFGIRDTGFGPRLGILGGTVDSRKLKVKSKGAPPAAIPTFNF